MFRPCIDLHEGRVKQIVGGSLNESGDRLRTNFVSDQNAAWFAERYRRDGLRGGHVIMLGAGNEEEARSALAAFPSGLQLGGGVNASNARDWLDAGASERFDGVEGAIAHAQRALIEIKIDGDSDRRAAYR